MPIRHPAATAVAIAAAVLVAAPLAFAANPSANIPDPLAGVQCLLSAGQVVGGPCAVVNGSVSWQTPAVAQDYLNAINAGRHAEALGAIRLPSGFASETADQQFLTLMNTERADRGLPPVLAQTAALDQAAATGAADRTDPTLGQTGAAWGSVWGEGGSVLAIWFDWMYSDGWGGSAAATPNVDCTGPGAPGCWGHRDVLLGTYGSGGPAAGIAVGQLGGGQISAAIVLTAGAGRTPTAAATRAAAPAATTPAPTVDAAGFTDLLGAAWAVPAITALHAAGALHGTSATTFSPLSPETIAQLATMTGRLFNWRGDAAAAPAGTPRWAAADLAFAADHGYLAPTADPAAAATRGTAAALLAAALDWPGGAQAAASGGLICGTGTDLDLNGSLTRAAAAQLLYRAAWLARPALWANLPATYQGGVLLLGNPASPAVTQVFAAGC